MIKTVIAILDFILFQEVEQINCESVNYEVETFGQYVVTGRQLHVYVDGNTLYEIKIHAVNNEGLSSSQATLTFVSDEISKFKPNESMRQIGVVL